MSYVINKTDGSVLSSPTMPSGILAEGTIDTTTGLTLIGRNYSNYGDAQNENFVRLLENFADNVPPTSSVSALNALPGTLWYDTGASKVRVYDGTNWNTINGVIVAEAMPSSTSYSLTAGDQWYDTVNQQLRLWNGTTWVLIGPQYTLTQTKSGTYVESITDTTGSNHIVVIAYTGENVVSITSFDAEFTPLSGYFNFTTIKPGVNIPVNKVFNGRSEDSTRVGGFYANAFARVDADTTFTQNLGINGRLSLTNANLFYSSGSLVVQNTAYLGDVSVFMNTTLGNTRAVSFNGSTGLGTVAGNPTEANGIATKSYVDTSILAVNASLAVIDGNWKSEVSKLRLDTGNYMTANVGILNSNIASVQSSLVSSISTLSANVNTRFEAADANAAVQQTSINSINSTIANLAPKYSPVFTGSPMSVTATPLLRNNVIATTSYVDSADDVLRADYNALVAAERAERLANVVVVTNGYALIDSQTFTGTPRVPTPNESDSSTRIASTAFVRGITDPLAPKASPALTGTPTAPTPAPLSRDTKLATTAYVNSADDVLRAEYTALIDAERSARIGNVVVATNGYALVNSQAFTGTPTVPTPAGSDNSTRIANTAFVRAITDLLAPKASPALTGTPTAPTAAINTNSTVIATTAYVDRANVAVTNDYSSRFDTEVTNRNAAIAVAISVLAPKSSPALTGTPTATTASPRNGSTRIATTAYVDSGDDVLRAEYTSLIDAERAARIAGDGGVTDGFARVDSQVFTGTPRVPTPPSTDNSTRIASTAHVYSVTSGLAPLASPALTGTPTAPTQPAADSSTKLATTAFVQSVLPKGAIIMWAGAAATIPTGWALCNGLNGTPDLRNRFIVGAGSTYTPGETGGSATTTITDVPAHGHAISVTGSTSTTGAHSHSASSTSTSTSNSTSNSTVRDTGHSHPYVDTYFKEHWGSDGAYGGNNLGSNGGQDNDNYDYNYSRTTSPSTTGITVSTTTNTTTNTSTSTIVGSTGDHNHAISISGTSSTTGVSGGITVPTRPPYYALCYIQKVN